jgi:hypothetical protein
MSPNLIFLPLVLQVLLTFAVGFRLMHARMQEMKARGIRPEDLRTRVDSAARFEKSRATADNFQNLFEFPVLFYVLVIVAHLTGAVSWLLLTLLLLFVASRIVHSVVHLSYNKVMHRFLAFVVGVVTLFAGWVVLILHMAV